MLFNSIDFEFFLLPVFIFNWLVEYIDLNSECTNLAIHSAFRRRGMD